MYTECDTRALLMVMFFFMINGHDDTALNYKFEKKTFGRMMKVRGTVTFALISSKSFLFAVFFFYNLSHCCVNICSFFVLIFWL